jgi:hypothetical protein
LQRELEDHGDLRMSREADSERKHCIRVETRQTTRC